MWYNYYNATSLMILQRRDGSLMRLHEACIFTDEQNATLPFEQIPDEQPDPNQSHC